MMNRRHLILGLVTAITGSVIPPSLAGASGTSRRGTFSGASGHVMSGTGRIVQEGERFLVRLEDDFRFDGAPDPKVALGRNGYDPATQLGALRANRGAQDYTISDAIDAQAYTEIWIWCERFGVPLGSARLMR